MHKCIHEASVWFLFFYFFWGGWVVGEVIDLWGWAVAAVMTWLIVIRDLVSNWFYRTSHLHFIYGRNGCLQRREVNTPPSLIQPAHCWAPGVQLCKTHTRNDMKPNKRETAEGDTKQGNRKRSKRENKKCCWHFEKALLIKGRPSPLMFLHKRSRLGESWALNNHRHTELLFHPDSMAVSAHE